MHVLDDQEHWAVQASHIPVQCLQAAAVHGCAVDQLPRTELGPCRHMSSKLRAEKGHLSLRPDKSAVSYRGITATCRSTAHHLEVVVIQQLAVVIQDNEIIFNLLPILCLLEF